MSISDPTRLHPTLHDTTREIVNSSRPDSTRHIPGDPRNADFDADRVDLTRGIFQGSKSKRHQRMHEYVGLLDGPWTSHFPDDVISYCSFFLLVLVLPPFCGVRAKNDKKTADRAH